MGPWWSVPFFHMTPGISSAFVDMLIASLSSNLQETTTAVGPVLHLVRLRYIYKCGIAVKKATI